MMKRVVLLGDSIRLGYEATVRAELADQAFVWSPSENGQHTVHLLLNFWTWVVAQQPDVLHLNAGLWDTRRIVRGEEENIVPLATYRENVDRLIALAQRHTKARIIWATSTPCNQSALSRGHLRLGLAGRCADDVPVYNQAAVEVARARGVVINDLYALVMATGPDRILDPDGTHYTAEGYAVLGKAVAEAIRPQLSL